MDNNMDKTKDIEKNKDIAALSYLWVFSLIILLARRDSDFIHMHAKQGTLLFVMSILLWPIEILRYAEFLVLALVILGFIEAVSGHEYRIPVIADIADGKIRKHHFHKAWHTVKHTFIKIFKPEHITPTFKTELHEQEKELSYQEKTLETEKRLLEQEGKKLSALLYRVEDDEKHLHELEDEVNGEFNKLEEEVNRVEEKVEKVLH